MANASSSTPPIDTASAGRLILWLEQDLPIEHDERLPTIPGYRLDRVVGSGASGVVYRAFREGSDRPVALKVMRPEISAGSSGHRALRELEVLEHLRLDVVPRLIDYSLHDGRLCIASEFVEGLALDRYADSLDRRRRADLLARVADAVQTLHEHGVIHRDLKPRNIIVTPRGDPMVVDFGLAVDAAAVHTTLTTDGSPVGTPSFMAPEQARGDRRNISTRSDVYALGAIGYVLLAGHTPHDTAGGVADALRRVATDPPRDPRALDPTLPIPLAAVLRKAVEPDAQRRYATAAEFALDLRHWLKGEPVTARPPTKWQHATTWIVRHPKATTAAAMIVIAGVVLGTAFTGLDLIRNRPSHFILSTDGSKADLVTAAGNVLHSWNFPTSSEAGMFRECAKLVNRPARLGGGRLALVLTNSPALQQASSGPHFQLEAWDVDRLDRPLWQTSAAPPEKRGRSPSRPANPTFQVRAFLLADVFSGPEHSDLPGPEIITLHSQDDQPGMLRVYDLAGRVLFEVLHCGALGSVQFLPGSELIVVNACDNSYEPGERAADPLGVQYVSALLAIRAKRGATLGEMNGYFEDPDAVACIAWRRYLTANRDWPEFNGSLLRTTNRADPSCHVGWMLAPNWTTLVPSSFWLTVDAQGSIVGRGGSDGPVSKLDGAREALESIELTADPPRSARKKPPPPDQ